MSSKKEAPRLGRGLAALLGAQDGPGGASPAAAAISVLPIEALEGGPFQPRQSMAPEALDELAASIKAQGVLQPILARPHPQQAGRYQIIAGERRWRAAQQAGLHQVPVHLRPLSDGDAMAAALVENLQRQDLNAIEEAEGLRRLTDEFKLTQERLAETVGKSRSHVANTIRLLQLPKSVRTDVQAGRLSAGHARALLGHPDPARAALQVITQGLTVRQTEALAQRQATGHRIMPEGRNDPDAVPRKDPEIAALEKELREKLGLDVRVTFDGRGGQLRLSYRSLDQLDGILALLRQ